MRVERCLTIVPCLVLLVLGGLGTRAGAPSAQPLDPDCVQFHDPTAVSAGEVVYVGFTAYGAGLDHAVDAWAPERGFAVPFREVAPTGIAIPPEAHLVYRDATIPGAGFKGVTVAWSHAPVTITLNLATLPNPTTTDPQEQDLIKSVVTHETGHALGLGDVPRPGVRIQECAHMLMKRSAEKGGTFIVPQPADIALYCMRWGGGVCGEDPPPTITPGPGPEATPALAPTPTPDPGRPTVTYRYFVVTCQQPPADAITPAQVESGALPADPPYACARAPVGVLLRVEGDGFSEGVMTDERGELSFGKPDGVEVRIDIPETAKGQYESLPGYEPADPDHTIPASDPDCLPGATTECKRVYVLVPQPLGGASIERFGSGNDSVAGA